MSETLDNKSPIRHYLRRWVIYSQNVLRELILRFPRNGILYWFCKCYVDYYKGENDTNMFRNGEARFLKKHLKRCGSDIVVFDVGANRGEWSEIILGINPKAKIHCFEPGNQTFRELGNKGFPANVVCNNFALGSRSGVQKLVLYGETSKYNSFFPRYDKESKSYQEVVVNTIDDYCKQHRIAQIDYLKVDVEGSEFDVLRGAVEILSSHRIGIIQFEYGTTFLDAGIFLKDMYQFAANFDYEVYKILLRGLSPVNGYRRKLENFHYSNYVLISKDNVSLIS